MEPQTSPGRLTRRTAGLAIATSFVLPSVVGAQTGYPTKPIRVVVPVPAGSSPDVIARFWGDRLSRALGQPVLVDNRAGAATIIGTQAVATAPADGYTLLFTNGSTFSINPFIYAKLPYRTEDFAPIVSMVAVPFVLVVGGESPFRTMQDLVRAARERPGELSFASYGVGTTTQAVFARFAGEAGIRMQHVPYRDGGIADIAAGRVDASFEPATTAVPLVRSGRMRGLAVTSGRRLESIPDVPTLSEGFPGLVMDGWLGLLAPAATPPAVIATLAAASNRIIASDEFRLKVQELGLRPVGGSPAEFQRFMQEDARVWSKVARENHIQAD